MGLRSLSRSDSRVLNNKDWGMLIELTAPDGTVYNTDSITGDPLVSMMTLNDAVRLDPDTGETIVVGEPIISIHRDSLVRVPAPGEKWFIKLQLNPDSDTMTSFMLSPTRSPEGGASLGFIRLYLQKVKQVPAS